MKKLDANLNCPSCSEPMRLQSVVCDPCGVKIEADFQLNEFARLSADELHFLRIFVRCEGKVREMEAALGLSYPTIRTRLAAFKNKIEELGEIAIAPEPLKAPKQARTAAEVLQRLGAGELEYAEALKQIKLLKEKK